MFSNRQPSNRLTYQIERETEIGESVEWIEMPIPRFFTPTATSAFLFGLPWTAFALFWTAAAAWGTSMTEGVGFFRMLPLFGVPFICIGFGMLLSPLWAYRNALHTVYVITNRRAITFEGAWSTTIKSYRLDRLQEVYRKENADGSGDVIFARRIWRDSEGGRNTEESGFLRVRDPRKVESLIRKLAERSARHTV